MPGACPETWYPLAKGLLQGLRLYVRPGCGKMQKSGCNTQEEEEEEEFQSPERPE